ncbi:hypothetical protein HHI36_010810 [Cryptolaemus montrouzieri]|uniref:Uncharacterized protein n=1 Tax=Cryptolaemus montrouzieri TaxID=559131 RepID=A0ABD2MJV5_9CUCU
MKMKESIEKLQDDNMKGIELHTQKIDAKNKVIETIELNLKQMEAEKDCIIKKHKDELEQINRKHKEEIENIEFEMLKTVHDAQKSLDEENVKIN